MRVYSIVCRKCRKVLAKPSKRRKFLIKQLGNVLYATDFVLSSGKQPKEGEIIVCSEHWEYGTVLVTDKGDCGLTNG